MAQLCAGAMYETRPGFHFNSAISGSDGSATVSPSGTPGIDRATGNDGTSCTGPATKLGMPSRLLVFAAPEAGRSARRWPPPEQPIPERCVEAYYFQGRGSRASPAEAATVPVDRGPECRGSAGGMCGEYRWKPCRQPGPPQIDPSQTFGAGDGRGSRCLKPDSARAIGERDGG
jgi:hypothetical protein